MELWYSTTDFIGTTRSKIFGNCIINNMKIKVICYWLNSLKTKGLILKSAELPYRWFKYLNMLFLQGSSFTFVSGTNLTLVLELLEIKIIKTYWYFLQFKP